jgi:hypothetical protein
MVSETLAQYSAMMVLETTYGPGMARRFYDYNMNAYLSGRGVYANREAPLLDVERQSYVYYAKGAVAMYALRERLGAEAVNGALRRFRERTPARTRRRRRRARSMPSCRRPRRTRCGRCSPTCSSTSRSGTSAPTPRARNRTARAPGG